MPRQQASSHKPASYADWFDLAALAEEPSTPGAMLRSLKQCLANGNRVIAARFDQGTPTYRLLAARSWLVDRVLHYCWSHFMGSDADTPALVAVGGYGRSELMPGSDIDLMLLMPDTVTADINSKAEALLTFLWDIRLEVGHSVRTIADCVEQSLADITVVTNLMESRLLAGSRQLYSDMLAATAPDKLWNSREFFEAKLNEQHKRHHKYHDTGYNLEPNIKEGPGGLRDIQMITWVTKRHFGTASLEELVERGFLTQPEYQTLVEGRDLLWKTRFALHTLTGRTEDRLLFDYQRTLAEQAGYHNDGETLGVEAFMRVYYRTIMKLSRLNEMLLQLFHEEILTPEGPGEPVALNKRFQARNGYLEAVNAGIFSYNPMALLEMFLVLAQHPELKGVRADTIRAIRTHRDLIDDKFRNDLRARSLFMEIIRQPHGVTHELRRMNSYGVLAAYLPAFGRIVGLMQYDLFHTYTVDEHILRVVRNLRRFTVHEFATEFPLCSHVISTIPKPELLYIAGLFHDIAKGRGGDHSELGKVDAREFCERHDLSEYDTNLVIWLVEQHLLMSATAQQQDIDDPVVVNRFARTVNDTIRLDYLYLLTVADIRATNPAMWNNWKDALLKQLYYNTRRALQRGLQDPLQRSEQIQSVKAAALDLLGGGKYPAIWEQLEDEYFLRHVPAQIAAHTRLLEQHDRDSGCLVNVEPDSERGGTEIFIYTRPQQRLFSRITSVIEQLGLNVVDAGMVTMQDQNILETFHVLEADGQPVTGDLRMSEINATLKHAIDNEADHDLHVSRRLPRTHKHFPIKTHIAFRQDLDDQRTIMELITADRPGLLSRVGRAFADCGIRLWNAKIATLGSRAEDFYYITDLNSKPLTEQKLEHLDKSVRKYLEQEDS
ncbi:MAG TPA: [protein-PII] uridylyltransferase [Gammaproteobacteria bacterium]|jgi:[protein-PII] uridylyltransferase|nr:[protein-PII] uridylyltransferase [Gammaproteobacteria bacterium]